MNDWSETAFLALGANLGGPRFEDPVASVTAAIGELRRSCPAGRVTCASLWRTPAVDCPEGSPDFVNTVVGIPVATFGSPTALLAQLQEMERRFGRPRERAANSPRSLDLDIITYGLLQWRDEDLVIPHPRAAERRFVLRPLAEIAPELHLPGEARTVAELLESAPALEMERISS